MHFGWKLRQSVLMLNNNLKLLTKWNMAKDLFSTLDLNLLRTFIILHQERNMRRAAERLFVSQPAVSKALQRLRDHFEDELFVKTHHGLRATEYANDLAESLAPLLDDISITINGSKAFNPLEMNGKRSLWHHLFLVLTRVRSFKPSGKLPLMSKFIC